MSPLTTYSSIETGTALTQTLGYDIINEKGMDNKLVKIPLIVLAVIGLLAIIGFLGMGITMSGMMGR